MKFVCLIVVYSYLYVITIIMPIFVPHKGDKQIIICETCYRLYNIKYIISNINDLYKHLEENSACEKNVVKTKDLERYKNHILDYTFVGMTCDEQKEYVYELIRVIKLNISFGHRIIARL